MQLLYSHNKGNTWMKNDHNTVLYELNSLILFLNGVEVYVGE